MRAIAIALTIALALPAAVDARQPVAPTGWRYLSDHRIACDMVQDTLPMRGVPRIALKFTEPANLKLEINPFAFTKGETTASLAKAELLISGKKHALASFAGASMVRDRFELSINGSQNREQLIDVARAEFLEFIRDGVAIEAVQARNMQQAAASGFACATERAKKKAAGDLAFPAEALNRRGVFKYPVDAKAAGIEGAVKMQLLVGSDGAVKQCRVVASSGNAKLDADTCKMASGLSYLRAQNGRGEPIDAMVEESVNWKLLSAEFR